jgi:large subunit ribosomal protein L23
MSEPTSVILGVQVTEKGTYLAEQANQYLFRVARTANKVEIKKAVESLFNVTVRDVNTMNYKGKRKRERTINYGKRADWKRAVVTLKEGDSIEVA